MAFQYFGYDREANSIEEKFSFPDEGLLCMVSEVTPENFFELNNPHKNTFSFGDYFVSSGSCGHIEIYGPFTDVRSAFEFAKKKFGVVSFRSLPEFIQ